MKNLVMAAVAISLLFTVSAFAVDVDTMMAVLENVKQEINFTLAQIDKDLKQAAGELSVVDLKGDAARKILNSLRQGRPYVIDCSIIDANGIKITVEPAEYKRYEGEDRSSLPSVNLLLKTKKPVMSDVYHSAEGIHAINIGYPILTKKEEFLGAVRMLIRYEEFLRPLVEDKPCKVWVMQKNGLIVYDADPEEIGRNIFTDSMFKPFKDLISFSRTVALSRNGAGSYDFYANGLKDKTLVQKIAAWDTAGIYGAQWRLIAMEISKIIPKPVTLDNPPHQQEAR